MVKKTEYIYICVCLQADYYGLNNVIHRQRLVEHHNNRNETPEETGTSPSRGVHLDQQSTFN